MRRSFFAVMAASLLLAPAPALAQMDEQEEEEAPHDHNHQGAGPAMQAPPQNSAAEAPGLPSGSIDALILDGDAKPMAGVQVTLGIVENTVAKGESREQQLGVTGADGKIRWDQLKVGMGFAYRVSVKRDGATFAVTPFQLGPERGMTTKLYVFPVVRSIQDAVILSKGATYIEIKDDRVQIEQMFTIANFGKTAWVPEDYVISVPDKIQAFTNEQGMTDVGVDKIDGKSELKLHGTFAPGQQQIVYRWQLPYTGEHDMSIDVDAPPNMAQARVLAAAAQKMKLECEGMSPSKTDELQGQRVLTIDWDQLSAKAPMKEFRIRLHDIPEAGLPSWLMRSGVGLAALVSLSAIVVVRSGKRRNDVRARKNSRAHLLEELAQLERAHQSGEVGPKTYERARRELVDQIALTLAAA